MGHTWVKGSSGWYMAFYGWDAKYAEHLRSLGYEVVRSPGTLTKDHLLAYYPPETGLLT